MSEANQDNANVALMLDEEIQKRVSTALLNILRGMPAGAVQWTDDPYDHVNYYSTVSAQEFTRIALMNLLSSDLQTLIRQEIYD
jgi:hypothetical protein